MRRIIALLAVFCERDAVLIDGNGKLTCSSLLRIENGTTVGLCFSINFQSSFLLIAFVSFVEIANSDAEEVCRRPDCDVSDAPEFYVVEKVLGRALAETANGKVVVIWLVKWEGCVYCSSLCRPRQELTVECSYPMDACAWEPTKNLEGSKRLLKDFYRQAKLEGRDWRNNDTVILKEAFDGGYSL